MMARYKSSRPKAAKHISQSRIVNSPELDRGLLRGKPVQTLRLTRILVHESAFLGEILIFTAS